MSEWHRENPELMGTEADPWMIHESYRALVTRENERVEGRDLGRTTWGCQAREFLKGRSVGVMRNDPSTDIYESAAVERLAAAREFNAAVWAREFVTAAARTPEMVRDEETMLSWFAVAIMNGHARASRAASSRTQPTETE
jgi:hypothetical protein